MEDKRMERQRQGPLPLILFDFTVSGLMKHTHAFAFVSFIEPVPSQAHGSCLTAETIPSAMSPMQSGMIFGPLIRSCKQKSAAISDQVVEPILIVDFCHSTTSIRRKSLSVFIINISPIVTVLPNSRVAKYC